MCGGLYVQTQVRRKRWDYLRGGYTQGGGGLWAEKYDTLLTDPVVVIKKSKRRRPTVDEQAVTTVFLLFLIIQLSQGHTHHDGQLTKG